MKTHVKREWLISKLKENRAAHRKVFEEAHENFKKRALDFFKAQQEAISKNKHFETYLHLTQPKDQTNDYDRTISMLEVTQEDVIELSEQDFARYVQDNWEWKQQFTETTSFYNGR